MLAIGCADVSGTAIARDGGEDMVGVTAGGGADCGDAAFDGNVTWSPPARTFLDAALSGSIYNPETSTGGRAVLIIIMYGMHREVLSMNAGSLCHRGCTELSLGMQTQRYHLFRAQRRGVSRELGMRNGAGVLAHLQEVRHLSY